jgi:signal transduction histidine kinase
MRGERKHVWARIDATAAPGPSNGAAPPPRRDTPPADGGRTSAEPSHDRIRGVINDRAAELGFLPVLRITGPVPELTSDIVIDLLAVLCEALTNVARHARARSAHVALAVTDDAVTLRVRDDGIGLAAAPRDGGLADLRRRAAWHGGTLSVQLDPDGGTRLTWAVPRRPSTPRPRPRPAG